MSDLFGTWPNPGMHEGVPSDVYFGYTDAMNCSTLLHGRTSMRHLKAAIDGELKLSSDALDFGKAVHCYLLEPDVFASEYEVAGPCEAVIKGGANKGQMCGASGRGKRDGKWYCGKKGHSSDADEFPTSLVSRADHNAIKSMGESLKRHKAVRLLRQNGGCEVSCVGELEGVLAKCRLDKWVPPCRAYPNGCIVDVKTISRGGGTKRAFGKSVDSYSYDVRAAWYVDVVEVLTGKRPEFVWVCIEKETPFAVGVYEASPESIQWGRREYTSLLWEYLGCRERERICERLDAGDEYEDAVANSGANVPQYRYLVEKCGGVERAIASVRDCWPDYTTNIERLPAAGWKVRQLAEAQE